MPPDTGTLNKAYERLDQLSCLWNNLTTGGNFNRSSLNQLEDLISGLIEFLHQHKGEI